MSVSNPTVAQQVLLPIDGTASQPSIRIGGTLDGTGGTGIYGTMAGLSVSVAGTQVLAASATGLAVTGAITSTAPLRLLAVTTTARDALTPVAGMLVLNTTTGAVNVYIGSGWVALAAV